VREGERNFRGDAGQAMKQTRWYKYDGVQLCLRLLICSLHWSAMTKAVVEQRQSPGSLCY
jgi:hypothetical protein